MAERRMFAKTVIDSDAFLDMPMSTQALYFHLAMRADDDGFINNSKRIQRMIGASDDDMRVLIAKQFIIPFETGVIVIKHWKMHNYIRSDRYNPTTYKAEKSALTLDEKGIYEIVDTTCQPCGIPAVSNLDTQDRLGKDRLGKVKEKKVSKAKSFDEIIGEYTQNEALKISLVEFVKMRSINKRQPLTSHGLDLLLKKLDKLGQTDAQKIEIVDQSVMRGWAGFFAVNEGNKPKQDKPDEKPKEEPKVYAHPFDDGSDPEYTRRALEAQKRRGW